MYDPNRLRTIMEEQGRRWGWLADQTRYDPATVSRFAKGAQPISDEFATRAARALGIPVDWLRADQPVEAVA